MDNYFHFWDTLGHQRREAANGYSMMEPIIFGGTGLGDVANDQISQMMTL